MVARRRGAPSAAARCATCCGGSTFSISGLWLLLRFLIVGAVSVVLWAGVNYLVALLYNAIADVIGGIEIAVEDIAEGPSA